ncbi:MAG: hypothetical protein V9G29_05625 [Burkholderiaceae bacterium]
MSRSAFAAEFKLHVGITPAEYLLRWRVSLAQSMLLGGKLGQAGERKAGLCQRGVVLPGLRSIGRCVAQGLAAGSTGLSHLNESVGRARAS